MIRAIWDFSPEGARQQSPGRRPGWPARPPQALKGRDKPFAQGSLSRPFRAGHRSLPVPQACSLGSVVSPLRG